MILDFKFLLNRRGNLKNFDELDKYLLIKEV